MNSNNPECVNRIFVACGFTWNNKGDAALLMATAQALRLSIPNVKLSFSSFTPELDSERYKEHVVRMPVDPSERFSRVIHRCKNWSPLLLRSLVGLVLTAFKLWLMVRVVLPKNFAYQILGSVAPTAREILESDLVVALPGGYLQATNWRDDYWLFHWLTLSMAKAAGKKIIIYAQSIGPFESRHKKWAVDLLKKIDVISVREDFSFQRLKEYGISDERMMLVPDAAFGLTDDGRGNRELEAISEKLTKFPQPWIGVSVREHHFPGKHDPEVWMEKYLSAVAQAADRMMELTNGTVFFVPQCIRSGGKDIEVSHEVVNRMQQTGYVRVLDEDLSPLALQVLYSKFDMLIGTRMHANILTMCAGTPVAAIAYERKTNGIMKMLGQDKNVINIEDVESDLLPLVDRVFAERHEIRIHLEKEILPLRLKALATPTILIGKLRDFVL